MALALKKIVAIEIDETRLRLVCAKKLLRGFEVSHAITLEDFNQKDPLALRPAVEDFFQRCQGDRRSVVVALPRSRTVVRALHFPTTVKENLANILEYQVENFEPLDRAELAYTYQIAGNGKRRKNAPNEKLDVLLTMARRADVEQWRHYLAAWNIVPRAMICSSFGLARLVGIDPARAPLEASIVLRIEESGFELLAVKGRTLRETRRGNFTPPDDADAAPSRGAQILSELQRLMSELRWDEKDLKNVLLCGTGMEALLAEIRTASPHLPVHPLRVSPAIRTRLSLGESSLQATAIGSALLGFTKEGNAANLLSPEHAVRRPAWVWAPTYALCAVSLLLVGAGGVRPYVQEARFLNNLNAEVARLQPRVHQVERIESADTEIQKKAAVLEAQKNHDALTLEALRELTEILPDTTWINDFYVHGDVVEISGTTDSATALVPLIEQSPVFKEVALASGITRNQQGKELFRLRAKLEF